MKILHSYVCLKLLRGFFFACLLLSALSFVSVLIKEVRGAEPSFIALMSYGLHLLPYLVYQMLPFGCIVGTALVLRSLAGHGELVVMRCLGLSGWSLALVVIGPAFLWGIIAVFWMDYLAIPVYKASAPRIYHTNVWIPRDEELLYIRRLHLNITGSSQGEQVVQFVFDERSLAQVTRAAKINCDDKNCRAQGLSHWLREKQHIKDIQLLPRTLISYGIPPRFQSLSELWLALRDEKDRGIHYNLRARELWKRLMSPLYFSALALLMCLLTLYSSMRSSIMRPLLIAVGVGLGADTLLNMAAFAAMLTQFPLWVGSLAPVLILISTVLTLILRKA